MYIPASLLQLLLFSLTISIIVLVAVLINFRLRLDKLFLILTVGRYDHVPNFVTVTEIIIYYSSVDFVGSVFRIVQEKTRILQEFEKRF